jgi:hypothetical protein
MRRVVGGNQVDSAPTGPETALGIMNNETFSPRKALRLSAGLLLVGQILYVVVTQFHAGGDANNYPAVFSAGRTSRVWIVSFTARGSQRGQSSGT